MRAKGCLRLCEVEPSNLGQKAHYLGVNVRLYVPPPILAKIINPNSCSFNSNSMAPSLILLWDQKATYWIYCLGLLGGLWTFIAFHGLIGLIAFFLRQFK